MGTLSNYTTSNLEKRKALGGSGPGLPSHLSDVQVSVVVEAIVRADRGQQPKSQELNGGLSRKQARDIYAKTILPAHGDRLTGLVTAQPTTTARSAITISQQLRWHTLVSSLYQEIVQLNTHESGCDAEDVPPSWQQSFILIMQHFVLNADEACFMASDGNVKVYGDKGKKKHEKNLDDSRVSITAYRTGTAGGTNGPTGFALKGECLRSGYSNEFLKSQGCADGSCVVMTPNAFMTREAWEAINANILPGIRKLPFICDHPNWHVFLSLDGWCEHPTNLDVLTRARSHNILICKEEGDASHVNQAYDRKVALDDKHMFRDLVALLRTTTSITRGVVDQYGLLHCVTQCVAHPLCGSAWENSFKQVNMHPHHRLSFEDWVAKLVEKGVLQSGSTFTPENAIDKFWLLPDFWIGMTPIERRGVAETIRAHNCQYTPDCLRALHEQHHISLNDMQKIRVRFDVCCENPCTFDYFFRANHFYLYELIN